MPDNQELANDIGAALRAAEQSAQNGNLGQTIVDLGQLHAKLGQAFHAVNDVLEDAGHDPLEWDPIAGNTPAKGGGAQTNSGGGGKGEPPRENDQP